MSEFTMWPQMDRFLRSLTQEERRVIYEWSERVFDRSETLSGKMDRIFAKVPPLPHSIVLYRGLADKSWDEVIYDIEHFIATAVNPAAAQRFASYDCCYMKINVPAGAKILPVSFAHGLTRYPKDLEVLLPRQGCFRVAGSEIIDIEQHESSQYPPEIAAMIAQMMQQHNIQKTYKNEKLFVVLDYLPNGRMTRLMAQRNMDALRRIYNV